MHVKTLAADVRQAAGVVEQLASRDEPLAGNVDALRFSMLLGTRWTRRVRSVIVTRRVVGKLIETRMSGVVSIDDFSRLRGSVTSSYHSTEVVVRVSDVRRITLFDVRAHNDAVSMLRGEIPREVLRTAFLFDPRNSVTAEIQSKVTLAVDRRRRVFTNAVDLQAWLGPVLELPELARLREFLDEKD